MATPSVNAYGQNYVGNDDFRGYLAAGDYQGGITGLTDGGRLLNYVGNDGNVGGNPTSVIRSQAANAYQQYLGTRTDQNAYNYQQKQAQARQSATNASNAAGYDNQANSYNQQLSQLDPTLQTSLGNLQNSYNSNYNTLQDQNARATRDYNTSVTNNNNNFQTTKNGILNTTRSNASALQRLLGAAGAGNSSAALEQAPYAAALQGTQNLNQAQNTYATNQASLDTSYGDTQDSYKKSLDDLQQQLYQNQNSTKSQIAQQRANLLNSLSQAKIQAGIARGQTYEQARGANDYSGQISELLKQITGYGNNYASPIALRQNVSYTAPTAQDYSLGKQAVASNGESGAASDIGTNFLNLLTRRDKEGNILAA